MRRGSPANHDRDVAGNTGAAETDAGLARRKLNQPADADVPAILRTGSATLVGQVTTNDDVGASVKLRSREPADINKRVEVPAPNDELGDVDECLARSNPPRIRSGP